jgi:UDP-N-acetylmuramyl pentapeptide phosphotransferase/UDP-N-acetylglucosamine-1-phosphate transferase
MRAMSALVALLAFVVSLAVLWLLLARFASFALDRPNERSMHERPVPRTGGIAVLAGAAVAFGFGAAPLWLPALLALALAVLSFVDDLAHMPTTVRLAAHLAAAGLVVWYLLSPMNVLALVVLALAVAWTTNLYNFMDGSDGLAGGMALIGFGAYAVAARLAGELPLAVLSLALCAGSGAFLLNNFHPARIFMGDVGSIPLGFLAGALGLAGWVNDVWPIWFAPLVFAPFMCDATLTLIKRIARRERVWRAHRDHYYQRLVRMGFGHRRTAWIEYAAMLGCALVALAARDVAPAQQAWAVVGVAIVLAGVAVWVDVRWAQYLRGAGGAA